MTIDATASLDALADLGASGSARWAGFLNLATPELLPFPLTSATTIVGFGQNSQETSGWLTQTGALYAVATPLYESGGSLAATGSVLRPGVLSTTMTITGDFADQYGTLFGYLPGPLSLSDWLSVGGQVTPVLLADYAVGGTLRADSAIGLNAQSAVDASGDCLAAGRLTLAGTAPDDGQGDLSATALVDNAALAALDASSDATFGESVQCDALATLDADSDASFAEAVQCDALADVSAESDASFAESVRCDALAALDADTDVTADAIADCAAFAALDANTDLTVDAVCDVAALASLDSTTNATLIAIATVPGDVWLTAAGDLTAAGVLARAGATALDAATDSTARLNGAYLGFLTTAIARDPGFPIPVISGVPLPYLHGTTNTDLVSVAGVALPFNYVNYIDGGLILAQGGVKRPAFASFSAETDSTATAINYVNGDAALSADTDIETGMLWEGEAAPYGDGSFTALPAVTRNAASASNALGNAVASSVAQRDGISSVQAVGDLMATASADVPAQAALDADSAVAALAVVEHNALSGLFATTAISADSIALVPDSAFIDALGTLSGTAAVLHRATVVSGATADTACTSALTLAGNGTWTTTSALTATGVRIFAPALGPDGTGTVGAFAGLIFSDDADLISESVFLSDALASVPASSTGSGEGAVLAEPDVIGAPPLLVVPAKLSRLNAMPLVVPFHVNPVLKATDADELPANDPSLVYLSIRPVLKLVNATPTLVALKE